jgi:hypothetical protein
MSTNTPAAALQVQPSDKSADKTAQHKSGVQSPAPDHKPVAAPADAPKTAVTK